MTVGDGGLANGVQPDGQPGGDRLYVYYRVPNVALADTVMRAQAMQAVLRQAAPGLLIGLLRRPDVRDGEVTLMETYAGSAVAAGFEAMLTQAAEAASLPRHRHVERFVPIAAPAPAQPVKPVAV